MNFRIDTTKAQSQRKSVSNRILRCRAGQNIDHNHRDPSCEYGIAYFATLPAVPLKLLLQEAITAREN
jgi:hypothetical protein